MATMRFGTLHLYAPRGQRLQQAVAALAGQRRVVLLENAEDFARCLEEVEAILVQRPPRGLWRLASRLKLVQMIGAGVWWIGTAATSG